MFGLSHEILVLVGAGETQKEVLGFSEGIYWERESERRLYLRAMTDHERLWGEREEAGVRVNQRGLETRELSRFQNDFLATLAEVREVQTPFAEAFITEVFSSVSGDKRFCREGIAVRDLRHRLGQMKLRKTPVEIANSRLAARKSGEAHRALLRESWIGRREKDIALAFDLELRRRGIGNVAYESIVATGERSIILHARASERTIQEGELILVDAGGIWGELCADITRTFPSGKKFSPAQKTLYEIVLGAQKKTIAFAKPGVTLDEIHEVGCRSLADGLLHEGWLPREELLAFFYPHKTSHWLGKQVHDRCPYFEKDGSAIALEEGMIFTIEPALYMRGDEAPVVIRGNGIRIEDDVLVTRDGVEVLTSAAPKEISEIESLRAEALSTFAWMD